MYLQHWGLEASPFSTTPGVDEPYPSQPLDEAAARVDYLVQQRRRLGAVVGECGVGKSVALAAIEREQRDQGVEAVRVDGLGLSPRELLWRLATGLGAGADGADDAARLFRRVEDRLAENRWQRRSTLLLVDDADQLGPDGERMLARLARLEETAEARWTIVVALRPAALSRLNELLLHLVDLRVDLPAWTEEDTVGWVQTQLVEAGRYEPVFTDAALRRLHLLAEGKPRHVARLADYALLAGASARAASVTPEVMARVFNEIRWSPTAQAAGA
ncbi:hypothetical protein Mal64_23610 [Pseudobythopirellula maris]|uniref:ORC1/DEAH AAA+ ATPase domain-containing protein n=1 Tax=Pseudobythopirellula maris TaxID=2527991 RepID=A0A5C5ZRM8_9BACT|nr:AAA family ATPase [Pseudobythopirellula maris]TWT88873.1 hypothetical protein Mal64_23610 [Pseudobythopirellula maris]